MKKLKNALIFGSLLASLSICSVSQAHVLDGATEFNGHYYKAFEFDMKFDQAQKFCESMGGHLATAENFNENAVLQKIVDDGGKKTYFLGGYRDDHRIWRWVTSGVITDSNWLANEPYYFYMTMKKNSGAKWDTYDNGERPFICEWDDQESAHDSTM